MTTEKRTLADMERAGELDGYVAYAPTGLTRGVDQQIARGARCEHCHHAGLTYRGFRCAESYVAVAVCPRCDAAFLF